MKMQIDGQLLDADSDALPVDQALGTMHADEMEAFTSMPNIDMDKFGSGRNMATLIGQGLADAAVSYWTENPGTIATMVGSLNNKTTEQLNFEDAEMLARGDMIGLIRNNMYGSRVRALVSEQFFPGYGADVGEMATRAGENMRNLGMAVRHKFNLEQEKIAPQGAGEQIAFGIGSGVGSMLSMFAAAAVGGAINPAGGEMAPFLFSFTNEKAIMARELMDAGYPAGYVDDISSLYALPVAALDMASFRVLSKPLRAVALKAVQKTIGTSVTQASAQQISSVLFEGVKGLATEGLTEGIQTRIQTEFEIANKLKDRNWQEDITNDVVSTIVGGLIGGPTAVVGQLASRRAGVKKIMDLGLDRKTAGELFNQMQLEATILEYDTLSEMVDVSEHLSWVKKAYNKISGKEEMGLPTEIDEIQMPGEYQFAEGILEQLDAETVDKKLAKLQEEKAAAETDEEKFKILERMDALELKKQNLGKAEDLIKAADARVEALHEELIGEPPTQPAEGEVKPEAKAPRSLDAVVKDINRAERLAEGMRQEYARVRGEMSMTPAQVKKQAISKLRQVLNAYKTGVKISEQDFKAVQKAFKTVLAESNLSDKAKGRLLRQVLSVRNIAQFNDKKGAITDAINTVVRSEKVGNLQKLAAKVFDKMLSGQVSPKNQEFARHLKRVLQGKVPQTLDIESANTPADMFKAAIEEAAYELQSAGDDIATADRAFKIIKGYYENELQAFANFESAKQKTHERLAQKVITEVGRGVKVDALKEALDKVRQEAAKQGITNSVFPTPYTLSFMTILDMLDSKSGTPSLQGPLYTEFSAVPAFNKWIAFTGKSKEMIDQKGFEIYGKNFLETWMQYRGDDFLDIDIKNEEGERKITISRAGAMSLWLTTKMGALREDLLNMGLTEEWLTDFEAGTNVNFTEADYAWMNNIRSVLDYYAEQIAPIYEKLTGKPFRRVDNYYMIQRYMFETLEDNSFADNYSTIDSMLKEEFKKTNPSGSKYFKQRVKSKRMLEMPDVFQAITMYAMDMNHFLGYAEYVTKLQAGFQRPDVRKLMESRLPAGLPPVIHEYIDTLSGASVNRTADRKAMKGFFKLLGWYARNQIAPLKNIPRQMSSVAAFVMYPGVNAVSLAKAALGLREAVKSGELAAILDTEYMNLRFAGMFDFAAKYAEDMTHAEYFSSVRKHRLLGKLRRAATSKMVHDLVTASARYGDRWASVVGGLAVYQQTLEQTGDKNQAILAAQNAIEETQQPINPARLPPSYSRKDLPNLLLHIYRRTTGSYLDQYMRIQTAFKNKRIPLSDWTRKMLAFHVLIPLFEVMISTGRMPWNTLPQTGIAMVAGPLAYSLIFQQTILSILAGLAEGFTDDEIDIPPFMKNVSDSTLLGSFTRDASKMIKSVSKLMRYPDFETMWGAWKDIGQVGELGPIPTGWLAQTPEAIYDLLQGDFIAAIKRLSGYSDFSIEQSKGQ